MRCLLETHQHTEKACIMPIKVLPPIEPKDEDATLTFDESLIVQHLLDTLGTVPAIRTTRAFAKCGLRCAHEYVNSLKRKVG